MVTKHVNEQTDLGVKQNIVQRIMKDQLHMRFRKVSKGPIYLNSTRNLVLRQQGAMKVLEAINRGKVLINIDETWINESDFRRMKWRAYGETNIVQSVSLTPRVTLIAAVDTLGNVYLTLTQANSNNKTMEIYFHCLAAKLDRERPNWRDDSIVVFDGAAYHRSASTLRVLSELKVPVMFFGPHSYNLAPCELFFAFVKSTHLNPTYLPTGKK